LRTPHQNSMLIFEGKKGAETLREKNGSVRRRSWGLKPGCRCEGGNTQNVVLPCYTLKNSTTSKGRISERRTERSYVEQETVEKKGKKNSRPHKSGLFKKLERKRKQPQRQASFAESRGGGRRADSPWRQGGVIPEGGRSLSCGMRRAIRLTEQWVGRACRRKEGGWFSATKKRDAKRLAESPGGQKMRWAADKENRLHNKKTMLAA